ncbi:MAG: hypothetical protein Q9165_003196 [Trypethelium subeluteriae]
MHQLVHRPCIFVLRDYRYTGDPNSSTSNHSPVRRFLDELCETDRREFVSRPIRVRTTPFAIASGAVECLLDEIPSATDFIIVASDLAAHPSNLEDLGAAIEAIENHILGMLPNERLTPRSEENLSQLVDKIQSIAWEFLDSELEGDVEDRVMTVLEMIDSWREGNREDIEYGLGKLRGQSTDAIEVNLTSMEELFEKPNYRRADKPAARFAYPIRVQRHSDACGIRIHIDFPLDEYSD